ncbi:MAG TPA: trehalose-phosphatase [Actinomycetota bacterium]|nr:trehalose-phosphatase [Actinomycetota bacterium]
MDTSEAVGVLLLDPPRTAVILDFDGTLSEIAPTPEAAVPVPGARETVELLASRIGLVAVVSGRRASDVRSRLGADGVRYMGLYGLEDGESSASRASVAPPGLLAELQTSIATVEGAIVEPKGSNVAVHFRLSPHPDEAERRVSEILSELAMRHGMRVVPGKRILELAPANAPTKGESVRGLLEEAGSHVAAYAGDDFADLEAFAALAELEEDDGILEHAVRLAVRSGETPRTVLSAADLVLRGPRQLVNFLASVAEALD